MSRSTLVAFTDTHGSVAHTRRVVELAGKSKASFLLCAGDFSIFENDWEEAWQIIHGSGLPIYFIAGNHETEGFCKELESGHRAFQWVGLRVVRVGGVQIAGLDGTSDLSPHDGEDLESFDTYSALLKEQIDPAIPLVLLSHYPPAGTVCCGQEPEYRDGRWVVDGSKKPLGSVVVRRIVESLSPALVVCGHFHDRFGVEDAIGRSRIVNPGPDGLVIELPS